MRYFRGAIALSPTQDLPLLRQVMYSKFVTQTQLWQFMRHSGNELSRGSFWWRVKRLADNGFITRHLLPMVHYDPIFAMASSGLVYLVESLGTPYSGPEDGPEMRRGGLGVAHALGVNAVHLDLLRSRSLVSWEYEMEIRCRNELTVGKYAKDYDAIITLALGGRQLRFALEYERTLKSSKQYERVRAALQAERQIACILYLTSGMEVLVHLVHELDSVPKKLAFANAKDFTQTLLETRVFVRGNGPGTRFRELLQ